MAKDPSSNTTNDREDLVQNTENPQGLDPASDSDLDGASGGSFWSVVTDVLDDVVHVMPFTGPISDGVEMAVTGKTHMQNSIERSLNQAEIAGDAGDTSVGSVIGRAFLPNTYDEAQRKYVDKKFDEAMRDDLSSSFDEVDDQELFLASGGASAAGLLKAAKAFKRIGGEALGPALDAYMIYDSIQDRKEILHDTEIISANTQVYQKDSVQYQNLQNQYDQKIDEAVSLDKMILDVKNDIGKDNWPAFVDFVNNGQW